MNEAFYLCVCDMKKKHLMIYRLYVVNSGTLGHQVFTDVLFCFRRQQQSVKKKKKTCPFNFENLGYPQCPQFQNDDFETETGVTTIIYR